MGICFATVEQSNVGVVESCGKFEKLARPGKKKRDYSFPRRIALLNTFFSSGCICLNPCTESIAGRVTLRIQQLDVRVETKTQDNVFVTVIVAVQVRLPLYIISSQFFLTLDTSICSITSYLSAFTMRK